MLQRPRLLAGQASRKIALMRRHAGQLGVNYRLKTVVDVQGSSDR